MFAIFKREFKSYFTSPIGYIILAVFMFFSGSIFTSMYSGGYADISAIFSFMITIVMFLVPLLTMRLMSEDKRQKVDNALLSAPVSLWGIALGKFFAALSVFAICFSTTLIYQIIFVIHANPDWLLFFGNLIGTILLGAALIAIGLFISALTESQVVSAIVSFAATLVVLLMDSLAQAINIEFISVFIEKISFYGRYEAFSQGIIDISNIVFFLSFAAVFLFLTVRSLEKKRWS